jgi:hypothetical protein
MYRPGVSIDGIAAMVHMYLHTTGRQGALAQSFRCAYPLSPGNPRGRGSGQRDTPGNDL